MNFPEVLKGTCPSGSPHLPPGLNFLISSMSPSRFDMSCLSAILFNWPFRPVDHGFLFLVLTDAAVPKDCRDILCSSDDEYH